MSENIMRTEYPRPQMVRSTWQHLNGWWDFEFDFSKSKLERGFVENGEYTQRINVPFCPESKLSGIEFVDFIPACWYRRTITISAQEKRGAVLLHFGAVDYKCTLFVNGKKAGTHKGGYASFHFDITKFVNEGENTIVVYAEDDTRGGKQPRGKQCPGYFSKGCDYTRTTGIWQTVWLEFAPFNRISRYRVEPDLNNAAANFTVILAGDTDGMEVCVKSSFNGRPMGEGSVLVNAGAATLRLSLAESHPWDVGAPNLYDISIELRHEGKIIDIITGYFGLRNIYLKDGAIYLNNRPLFQRLVLDQGFYPDGVYTAPSDEALKQDIVLSMDLGFNGARMHEKIFEERFMYHADKLGYLVWGEHANWGLDHTVPEALHYFLPEWLEVIERDFNHPSLIGWCPFNETWDLDGKKQYDETLRVVYLATKAADPTRPVIDVSGYHHIITDVYDTHDYVQETEDFCAHYTNLKRGECYDPQKGKQHFQGQPFFVSEFGGCKWAPGDDSGWGYGDAPKTEEEFAAKYEAFSGALLNCEAVSAFCYTQLFDVEQEQNGLLTYHRGKKLSDAIYARIKAANERKAAIEG